MVWHPIRWNIGELPCPLGRRCEDVKMLEFSNKEHTQIKWTDATGVVRDGIKARDDAGVVTILGDGQIPDQVRQEIADGEPVGAYVALDYQLTRAQLRNMFVEDGKPADFIKTLVLTMTAGKPRERAIVMLEDTDLFPRNHILLVKIVTANLYTDAQIDTMWLAEANR